MSDDIAAEVTPNCLVTHTRRIARVVTSVYDDALRPFGIHSPQFSLLVLIARLGPVSRAEIGRANHQDRSTLARNLQPLLSEGWIEEVASAGGRSRPVVLTDKGHDTLRNAMPAWRRAQASARALLGDAGVNSVLGISASLKENRHAAAAHG